MITLDLRQRRVTIDELFHMASSEKVFIFTKEGKELLLTKPNEFDREVAQLGSSDKFMQFLAERSRERKGRSLDEVEKTLGLV